MYINTPQFENIFNNTEKQILLSNINENMLTRTDGNRNKLVKARANKLGMFFMEKLKYYRINDQTFEIIQNKFKTSPSSAGILVTEPNYKTLIHRDFGKRELVLNIKLKGAGKCCFENEEYTTNDAFIFNSKMPHCVDNLDCNEERIVVSICWYKKFTINEILENIL